MDRCTGVSVKVVRRLSVREVVGKLYEAGL